MDPAAAAAAEEEGREKPPVIYTMENKPIVTCESALTAAPGADCACGGGGGSNGRPEGGGCGGPWSVPPAPGPGEGRPGWGLCGALTGRGRPGRGGGERPFCRRRWRGCPPLWGPALGAEGTRRLDGLWRRELPLGSFSLPASNGSGQAWVCVCMFRGDSE